jgi:ATP-dependent Clp protease adaptor protein ClpS
MEIEPKQNQTTELLADEEIDIGVASRVVLYNDDWHTFDEVIAQLIIAVKCTYEQATCFCF